MTKNFSFIRKKQQSPKDNITYILPQSVISDTERVLLEYGKMKPSNEGFVYWCGTIDGMKINISLVIAPKTESNYGRVSTSNRSNFDVVKTLSANKVIEIAQVHSHPSDWVDHSEGDDKWASFKIEGLVSIVVPEYCKRGMLPLSSCGIHRYTDNNFIRLSNKYITEHFRILADSKSNFVDLRGEFHAR